MKENETKKNELVYQGSKSHGLIYHSHIKLRKGISYASIGAKKSKRKNIALNQVKGQNRYIHKTFKNSFTSKGKS